MQTVTKRDAAKTENNGTLLEPGSDVTEIPRGEDKRVSKDEIRQLRFYLKLFFYNAVKFKEDRCSFHLITFGIFLLQVVKIALITSQLFQFGAQRNNFNSIVNRGHTTLRHLLLRDWDSTWETLPYPPSRGEFASYNKDELRDRINTAVTRFHNVEQYAVGYFTMRPNDNMTATLKLFDLDGFYGYRSSDEDGLSINEITFPISEGLTEAINVTTNEKRYSYDVEKEFNSRRLDRAISRFLKLTLTFTLRSVRIFEKDDKALCLNVRGWITFEDPDKNGHIIENLETLTTKVGCNLFQFRVSEWDIQQTSKSLAVAVMIFSLCSIIATALNAAFGVYVFVLTKRFMKKNFKAYYQPEKEDENDLPWREYTNFFRFWDISSILADMLTLDGTVWLGFKSERQELDVGDFDIYTVRLAVGGLLAWFSILRFLNVHNKFNLLFNTINRAFYDVAAYVVFVGALFAGFWVCGYVVLGPYHVKFSTPEKASETLLSVVNGDEMYATLNLLEINKTGDFLIWWFSRFYFWFYIAIFVIVVINLLVAIFMSAYDALKAMYERKDEDRDLGPIERALRVFVETSKMSTNTIAGRQDFRSSMYDLLTADDVNDEEKALKKTLLSICRIDTAKMEIVLTRPRTIKAFLEEGEEEDSIDITFLCFTFSFLLVSKPKHQ